MRSKSQQRDAVRIARRFNAGIGRPYVISPELGTAEFIGAWIFPNLPRGWRNEARLATFGQPRLLCPKGKPHESLTRRASRYYSHTMVDGSEKSILPHLRSAHYALRNRPRQQLFPALSRAH
jgi:hypothetical protein